MKFSVVTLLASVTVAVAQTAGFDPITVPTQDQVIKAGSSFEIVWEPSAQTGTITITLLQGASPSTLQLGPAIASGIDNQVGKFVWNPVPAAQFATYGFKLSLDSNPDTFQYSFPFHIQGAASTSSATSTSVSTTSTTSTSVSTPSTTSTSASSPSAASTSAKDTSVAKYPTSKPDSYPTTFSVVVSPYSTYVPSTVTPCSTSSVPTTTPCSTESVVTSPRIVPTYQPTYPASPNSTWIQPTGTGHPTTTTTPTKPSAITGAATRFGTHWSAAIVGLLLALAI